MTITWIAIGVLMLVAVPVGAKEDRTVIDCSVNNPNSQCDTSGGMRTTTSCFARMQEAMKAMSPFLPYVHNGRALDQKELNAMLDKLTEAGKLWAGVERDCWSRP